MSDGSADIYKLIEVTNERLTDLQKSYRVLNDCHNDLKLEFTVMKTKMETIAYLVKFFVSPSLALLILAEVFRIAGVV